MNKLNNASAWIERAEEDFAVASSSLRRKKPLLYPACFHAQQCAEKYLKTILIIKQLPFPKTHDLLMLSALCNEAGIFNPKDQEFCPQVLRSEIKHPQLSILLEWKAASPGYLVAGGE